MYCKKCGGKLESYARVDEIKENVATPRYRLPRVNKLLLYPLLGITKSAVKTALKAKPVVKVLAIKKQNIDLLKIYDKNKISLISTNKDYNNLTKSQKQIIQIDLNASNIYNTILFHKNNEDKKIGTLFL